MRFFILLNKFFMLIYRLIYAQTIGTEIVEKFIRAWVAVFGRPERILADNGKEWCNSEFVSMCENLGIIMDTTVVPH